LEKVSFRDRLIAAAGREKVRENEPLSRYTTFHIGGPADYLVTVTDGTTLAKVLYICRGDGVCTYIIGRGSNVVFDDAGFRGVVIHLDNDTDSFRKTAEDEETEVWYAPAGASLSALAKAAGAAGLSGLEFAAGIPGSIGGGVVMNAGAYGGELKNCVIASEYIGPDGMDGTFTGEEQQFGYRHSVYSGGDYIVTGAYFRLQKGRTSEEIFADIRELNARRREKQPLEYPSAGSAFKRPEGDFAGRLIQASGLRGFSVGGVQVSEKHCGFIINTGGATFGDLLEAVKTIREKVLADSDRLLEPEIRFVKEQGGEWKF